MYHPVHPPIPLRCQTEVTRGGVCPDSCPCPCKNRFDLQPIGGRSVWCTGVILAFFKRHWLFEGSRAEPGCLGHPGFSFSSVQRPRSTPCTSLWFRPHVIGSICWNLRHMHYNFSAFSQLFASQQMQESQSRRRVSVISLFLFTSGTAAFSTAKAFMLSLCSHSSVSTLQRAVGNMLLQPPELLRSLDDGLWLVFVWQNDKTNTFGSTPVQKYKKYNKIKHFFCYFGTDHRARISFLCQVLPPTHELSTQLCFCI